MSIKLTILKSFTFLLILSCNSSKEEKEFQENEESNKSDARYYGGFMDTCMNLILKDIQSSGLKLGDFRILTRTYEDALATIPEDTSHKFYSYKIIYAITKKGEKETRAAAYLINMHKEFKKVYDVNIANESAKQQLEDLEEIFHKIKEGLEKMPDSTEKEIKSLKKKFNSL